MDLELIRKELQCSLNPRRYEHCLGVEAVAGDMAVIFGYDPNKAQLAGLLHDCARDLTDEQLIGKCREYGLPVSAVELRSGYLLHGKVGAVFAKEHFGVEDEVILDSIRYHTTGRPAMTLLEKIIFISDYIEPNRKPLPGMNEIRLAAYSDIDPAVLMVLENMLDYFHTAQTEIDTLTLDTYEYYKAVMQLVKKERGL